MILVLSFSFINDFPNNNDVFPQYIIEVQTETFNKLIAQGNYNNPVQ